MSKISQLQELLTPPKDENGRQIQKVIRVQIRCDGLAAIVNDPANGRLTLMIDNWKSFGTARFNQLVDFCDQFTGNKPVCRYEVDYDQRGNVATLITWCDPRHEQDFLRMLVNSNGYIGHGYENLTLFGDRKLSCYDDPTLRAQLAAH